MDHSYSTKRERLQKVDHCYFSSGKKTPKVVLRKAEVLKNSQKNNRVLIGEDHSYHKRNQLANHCERQSEAIENHCKCHGIIANHDLTIEKKSILRIPTKPSIALKVFKSKSEMVEKVIFYVNYFSQSGKKLMIKRTMKKYLRNKPQKVNTTSDPLKRASGCADKHSDHSYFSKKYRRTKSLPVICKSSELNPRQPLSTCDDPQDSINVMSNIPPSTSSSISPPTSSSASSPLDQLLLKSLSPTLSSLTLPSSQQLSPSSPKLTTVGDSPDQTDRIIKNNNDKKIMTFSQHDHSYLRRPSKSRKSQNKYSDCL